MHSILIIHMYFGKFPKMFPFWLKSCENNKDIDFLVVTDQDVKSSSPNIIVHKCTLSDVKKRAEEKLNTRISLERPGKLCDFKCVYGILMSEYSQKYDFWGYCDSDLVFGRIRDFITDDILSKFDYILGMGHFHLQRTIDSKFDGVLKSARGIGNNAFYEKDFAPDLFMENNDGPLWQEVFASPLNHVFDEFPYGVSARYYQMYPEKVWAGYNERERLWDEIDISPLYMRDSYNCYPLYGSTHYCQLKSFFPFWSRYEKCENDMESFCYRYEHCQLLRIGFNLDGEYREVPRLYTHFLHRDMKVKTSNVDAYMVRPNSFVDIEDFNRIILEGWNSDISLTIERCYKKSLFQIHRIPKLWKKIKIMFAQA